MPDHDLEPPRFSRRALERLLNDWSAIRTTIMAGYREEESAASRLAAGGAVPEDQQPHLVAQNGTALLDKFVHCLLVKCSIEVRPSLREARGSRGGLGTVTSASRLLHVWSFWDLECL